MKILKIPVMVYDTGDRVKTPIGNATVLHDELENFPQTFNDPEKKAVAANQAKYRNAVIVRVDGLDQDYELNRNDLILIKEKTPKENEKL